MFVPQKSLWLPETTAEVVAGLTTSCHNMYVESAPMMRFPLRNMFLADPAKVVAVDCKNDRLGNEPGVSELEP